MDDWRLRETESFRNRDPRRRIDFSRSSRSLELILTYKGVPGGLLDALLGSRGGSFERFWGLRGELGAPLRSLGLLGGRFGLQGDRKGVAREALGDPRGAQGSPKGGPWGPEGTSWGTLGHRKYDPGAQKLDFCSACRSCVQCRYFRGKTRVGRSDSYFSHAIWHSKNRCLDARSLKYLGFYRGFCVCKQKPTFLQSERSFSG